MTIRPLLVLLSLAVLPLAVEAEDESRTLADLLASAPARSDEDKARDAQRRPAEVLTFLGLREGDTVLDTWSSGGWYTEVLSIAVGPHGKVYSQNSPAVLAFRDGYYDKMLGERLAGNRLANVQRVNADLGEAQLAPGSIDFALTALNFHDVYNRQGTDGAAEFLGAVFSLLKPGGTLGLIDHAGAPGTDNTDLHRVDPALAEQAVVAAGFIVEAKSDLLAHPDDDHTQGVFDPSLRGETDRFILRLRKPE